MNSQSQSFGCHKCFWLIAAITSVLAASSPILADTGTFHKSENPWPSSEPVIPDAGGWDNRAWIQIDVSGVPSNAKITQVTVKYEIRHTWVSDLCVDLTAKINGQWHSHELWNREGGSSDNIVETQSFAAFDGGCLNSYNRPVSNYNANGSEWYLVAWDNVSGDEGSIDSFEIWIDWETPKVLNSVLVSGPSSFNEQSWGNYTATAYFSDGSNSNVTGSSSWSEDSSYTYMDSSYAGRMRATDITGHGNKSVNIYANYTYNGVSKQGSQNVTILNANEIPSLSGGTISPSSGDTSTDFYWYVDYFDADGDSPSSIKVYIDGAAYSMSLDGGYTWNGKYKYGPKNLSSGSHTYHFSCSDGYGGSSSLPSSGTYSGPQVIQAPYDAAEIVSFSPPTGVLERGTQSQATVRVKNTGNTTSSFWVGLSFAGPEAGVWPDGWYDIPPTETATPLTPGQEQTVTFTFDILSWLPPGDYDAVTAVWENYNDVDDLMVEPRYDDRTATSFTLEDYTLTDLEGTSVFATNHVYELPHQFRQELDYRSWLGNEHILGPVIKLNATDPSHSQYPARLELIIEKADPAVIDKFYGVMNPIVEISMSQLIFIFPNNVELSDQTYTDIDGSRTNWTWLGEEGLKATMAVITSGAPPAATVDYIVGGIIEGVVNDGILNVYNNVSSLYVDLPYETSTADDFTILLVDFNPEKWGNDILDFQRLELAFDLRFADSVPQPIGIVADLRYKLREVACPRTVLYSIFEPLREALLLKEFRVPIMVYPEALGFNTGTPVLEATPGNSNVSSSGGTTSFSVSNTGGGTMSWAAEVTDGWSWLSIISGDSGTNGGTITASYSANGGVSSRTGTIRITASGAGGSKDVTVTQAGTVVGNTKPNAQIDSTTPNPAQPPDDVVSFNGTGSDSDGTVQQWEWSSDLDGTLSTSEDFTTSSYEMTVGSHTISFLVRDNDGAWSDPDTATLTISNALPTATISIDPSGPVPLGSNITITLGGYDNDENGQSIIDGEVSVDGEGGEGGEGSDGGEGGVMPGSYEGTVDMDPGSYTLSYRVQDDEGTWSDPVVETLTVTAIVGEPVITSITPNRGPIGSYMEIQGTDFGSTVGDVLFDGVLSDDIISWTDTEIFCRVPDVGISEDVDLQILWQTDLNHTAGNTITGLKLTPNKNNLIVFHYTGYAYGIPGRFDKLDVQTGDSLWVPTKEVTKAGERIALSGWVDNLGNIYFGCSWGGYTLWKYDSELETELCSYTGSTGFEYVYNIMTDDSGNIYAAGHVGSWSGAPSTVVKLNSNCSLLWSSTIGSYTGSKDRFTQALALDSQGNLFHVGNDYHPGYPASRGRIIGHRASNGAVFINQLVDESNSEGYGVIADAGDKIYVGYSYNLWNPDLTKTLAERSVILKLNENGSTAWKYTFEDVGIYLPWGCIIKSTDNSFYVAFNLHKDGTVYPGIAEFDFDGNLLWKNTINKPGWVIAQSSFEADGDYLYLGLNNPDDGTKTKVLCLEKGAPFSVSDDFAGTALDTSLWSVFVDALGQYHEPYVADGLLHSQGYHTRIDSIPTFAPMGQSVMARARIRLAGEIQKFGFAPNPSERAGPITGYYFDTVDVDGREHHIRALAWSNPGSGSMVNLLDVEIPVTWYEFHEFAIERTPSEVIYSIDGQEVARVADSFAGALPVGVWNDRWDLMQTDWVEVCQVEPPCASSDDFEDGVIDTSLWLFGGEKRGYNGSPAGSWEWSHEEITDATDGYLRAHVWGPYTGNTYGAEAWIRTKQNFNDGKDYVINFTWKPDFADSHYNMYYLQITDGYIPGDVTFHWQNDGEPGTTDLLFDPDTGGHGWSFENEASPGRLSWSIEILASGLARLYDAPDRSGTLIREESLDATKPWYFRLMVNDGTSAGFGSGDAWFDLYDFCTFTESDPAGNQVCVQVQRADGATSNCKPFTITPPDFDADQDGVPSIEEQGPAGNDPGYDGNGDGVADCEQDNAASCHATTGDYVTITCPEEDKLSDVEAVDNPSPADIPPDVETPYGFFEFVIEGVGVGGATTVDIIVRDGSTVSSYYKYGPTPDNPTDHWYEFLFDGETGAEINGNVITLHLVDGLRGDHDITANGVIVEPGGPAFIPTPTQVVVDDLVSIVMGRVGYDRRTGQFSVSATVANTSAEVIGEPVWLVIESISGPGVTVANPDGTTADGKEYIDLSGLLGDGKLDPGETVVTRVYFNNPSRVRFTFVVSVRGVI